MSLPDAHKYSVSRSDVWAAVALLSIVGTALLLRRLFVTGIVFLDDLVYTHAAHDLLNGRLHVQDWPTAPTRVGLYAPVALSYLLLGTTESAALLFPLVSSLASLFVVYAIGRLLADERAGLIAAFLWAVFPIDVQMAGALLPDGPLAMLSATAVWLFLRARLGRGRHASVGYGLAFFCLSIAVLVKPLALIVVPFALCYLVVEQPNKIRPSSALSVFLLASLSLLVLATLTLSAYYYVTHVPALAPFTTRLAVTATDWTHRLLSERAFAAFIPLALVAAVALLSRPDERSWIALLWAGTTFALFELGSMSAVQYVPIPAEWRASQMLLVLLPFAVVSGIYLKPTTSVATTRLVVVAASILVTVVAWSGSTDRSLLSVGVTGTSPSMLPFATASDIALAVAVFGAIVSPVFVSRGPARVRAVALWLLLAAVGVASLHATQMEVLRYQDAWRPNFKEVAAFLRTQPPYPIFAQNSVAAARLNTASDFAWGFDFFSPGSQDARMRLVPPKRSDLGAAALVVVDDEHLNGPPGALWSARQDELSSLMRERPAEWVPVFTTGQYAGHRTRVFRFSHDDAQRELETARRAAAAAPDSSEAWARVIRAAASAGEPCAAAAVWKRVRGRSAEVKDPIDPVAVFRACYEQTPLIAGRNLLRNGDFTQGTDAWEQSPDSRAERTVERDAASGASTLHVTFRGGNWAVLTQSTTLEPDTAYVYRMRVRSTTPIVSLYWQADQSHLLEQDQTYPQWTDLVFVFVTPRWGKPTTAFFSPILVAAPGEVWVADVRLMVLDPPAMEMK